MGSRIAKNAVVTLATLCLLAVPATAIANSDNTHTQGQTQGQANGHQDEKSNNGQAKGHQDEAAATQSEQSGQPTAAPTTEPQPKSNADMNPGGANNGGDCGAYCSTRDGSPSENGKGDGAAVGKPCAGCVGKADNKNPPGQQPDGSDHNAGYECDRNQGIGKTNPAHTGCKTTEQSPSPTPTESPCVPTNENPCESESPCVPTNENPCESESPCVPTTDNPCETESPSPSVSATESTPATSPSASVKGVRLEKPPAQPEVIGTRLPTTGNTVSVALLLLIGVGLMGLGITMTVATPGRHH